MKSTHLGPRQLLIFCILILFPLAVSLSTAKELPPTCAFRNGLWFNGNQFESKTIYAVAGKLETRKPLQVERQIDLAGAYVIPPLAEAHNHWLEPGRVDDYIQDYLRDGVFYVKDEGNLPYIVSQFRNKLNRPTSVDYISALQGFTGPGGHPIEILRQFREMGILPKQWTDQDFDGKAVMFIADEKDIPSRWKALLEGKPDFVKVFLNYSEHAGMHSDNPKKTGLDPKFLPEIVKLAHQSGLYVSVHISTATDFHNALAAGADEIAHLPLVDSDPSLGNETFLIPESDARLAASQGCRVVTTLGWLTDMKSENPARAKEIETQIVIPNLSLMKRYGVKLLIGSDQFRQTSLPEILLLSDLHVFTNLELLKMACETTPQAIFPKRKIGYLREGYAASFLALERNPLVDMKNLKSIKLRVKEGVLLK